MKTLFARHIQSWPLCSHVTVPYIVTFSTECDVTAAISTEQEQLHLLDGGIGGHRACLENFGKRKFNSCCESKHDFSVASTAVAATFELYGVTHISLFLDCLGYASWKKFVYVNHISWISFIVCTLTGSGAAAISDRPNLTVHKKNRFRPVKEKISER